MPESLAKLQLKEWAELRRKVQNAGNEVDKADVRRQASPAYMRWQDAKHRLRLAKEDLGQYESILGGLYYQPELPIEEPEKPESTKADVTMANPITGEVVTIAGVELDKMAESTERALA
jgi:hypothetical protein